MSHSRQTRYGRLLIKSALWAAGVAIALLLTIACGADAGAPTPSNSISSGTWSIVAVDVDAAEVGVALATCVQPDAALSDGLVAALEAGAMEGGDQRCPREQAALTAFVAVARASDEGDLPSLWLTVTAQPFGGQNPVTLLRRTYDEEKSSSAEVDEIRGDDC